MVDAKTFQDCGLEVVHVDRILDDVVTVIVCGAQRDSGLDAATGHPNGEAAPVMVAPVICCGEAPLTVDSAAKLTTPNNESVIEHSPLLEVLD